VTPERGRFRGALLGLACGDALGTSVEFKARGSFPPLEDMIGKGTFALRAGDWTDDMSMALCLARSLVERGGFDARDQMQRYAGSARVPASTGAASTSEPFSTRRALREWRSVEQLDRSRSAGTAR
jgi:ADP-ribosylglycohydrolase